MRRRKILHPYRRFTIKRPLNFCIITISYIILF
nr:MAG TPA: hypothetical protein [Crassvirales sp.]